MSSPSLAQLADALAGLTIDQRQQPPPAAKKAKPPRTVGLLLDFHLLQVRALQYSLRTAWDVGQLESALVSRCCAGGQVLLRLAADSVLDAASADEPLSGKRRLHDQLLAAGFELLTAPNKRTERKQGATDVHVVTALYRLAGAFAAQPPVTDVIFVAADSDFQPALLDIAAARPALRLHVVAPPDCMRRSYRDWLRAHPRARIHNLDDILDALAPHVLNFEAWRLPTIAGRLDVEQVCRQILKTLDDAVSSTIISVPSSNQSTSTDQSTSSIDQSSTSIDQSSIDQSSTSIDQSSTNQSTQSNQSIDKKPAVVVRLSNLHRRFDDAVAIPLFEALHQHLLLRPAAVRNAWGQLWIHHTDITDAAAPSLAQLVAVLGGLTELHISDTAITFDGVALINAARSTLRCRPQLYVNARHLTAGPPLASFPALRLALARKDHPGSPKSFHRKEHISSPSKPKSSSPSKPKSSSPSKPKSSSPSKPKSSSPSKPKSSSPSKPKSSSPSKPKSSRPPARKDHPDSPVSPLRNEQPISPKPFARKPFKRHAEPPAQQQ